MADNSSIPVASGNETFANKDIAGVKYPQHIQVDSTGAEVVSATAAKQDTGNTSLATIATNTTDAATETTLVALNAKIPASPATTGGQDTGNASLATIATNTTDAATQTTAAAILAKLSADPATQTTLAAILAKLTSDPATQTTLAAVLAKLTADPSTETTLADVKTAVEALSALITGGALAVALNEASLGDIFANKTAAPASTTTTMADAGAGALGDYLSHVLVTPTTVSPGAISIQDGALTAEEVFVGGTDSLSNLKPFVIPWGKYSVDGGWKIVMGAGAKAQGFGAF